MKKIKKANQISAQSVYSFGCPCNGSCSRYCSCSLSSLRESTNVNGMSANNPHISTGV